ncbi:putative membrane protein [Siphonobacter sp. SORGH_AS 1065]|nr:putative membrane protein [Siphonobacter sp. SORGH_AS_1065]
MDRKTYLLILAPLIIALDLYAITWIFEWLSKASNAFVLLGIIGFSGLLLINYLLFKFTLTFLKS